MIKIVLSYTVDAEGETEISAEALDESNYDLVVDGKTLTLTFKGDFEVKDRYVVSFLTSVPAVSAGTYTNDAKVKVGEKEYPYEASVHYKEHDKFLNKSTVGTNGNKVFTGDEVNWKVRVNDSLSIIEKDVVITDTISAGHVYTNGSLAVFKLEGTEEVPLVEVKDYTLNVLPNAEEGATDLKIELTNELKNTLILRYKTVVTETSGEIGNKITLEGNNIEIKSVESERLNAKQFSDAGGQWASNRGAFEVTKVDAKTEPKETIVNNEASFTLWYKLNGDYVRFGGDDKVFKTENGVLRVGNLPLRTYYLREETAPAGYEKLDDEIEIVVNKEYNNNDENVVKLDVENTKIKTEVTAIKTWVGGPSVHPTIILTLYRQIGSGEKEAVGSVTLQDGATSYTWTDLDKTDMAGNEYVYVVDEEIVPTGYDKSIQVNGNIVTITNSFDFKKTDISAKKVWDGGPDLKPTIRLQLFRNDEAYQNSVALVSGYTEHTWLDLDVFDKMGAEYNYTVKEVEIGGSQVAEGDTVNNYKYEGVTIDDGKFVITNTYVSPKTEATGTKIWEKGPEEKPEIQLQLYRQIEDDDKESVGDPVILKNTETFYTWTDLDETDKDGKVYIYTVDEVSVPANYVKTVDGLTVTNTYVSPKISVTGNKIWEGGLTSRPTIELQLYRDGQAFGDPVELKDGATVYTWDDLDKTDEDGNDYTYTIDEVETPSNYGKSKSNDGLTITNTYESPKEDITGRKVWEGGPKPSIQLQLYRQVEDGVKEAVGDPVTLEDEVEYTWKFQDKTDINGNVYIYTVEEIGVPENYKKTEEGLTVTNTYVIPKTQVTGTKEWVNGAEVKPTIELQLYRDGEAVGEPVELKDGTLTYTWTDLDETNINGKKYVYTIDEVKVPSDYEKSINGLKITNTYVIPKKNVTGTKQWVGGSSTKPTIQLQLYRNGMAFGELVTLENEITEYTWYDLGETDINGNVCNYTIDEVDVPTDYEKTISENGLTVTNTYVVPKTDVTATKVWDGGSTPRPTIWFELYRQVEGGELEKVDVDIKELADGATEVTWEDVDKTDGFGNEYIYSVKEVDADGNDFVPSRYRKSEVGLTVTNTKRPSGGREDPDPVEKKGKIVVNKVDEDKKPLPGAEFTLYDAKGKAVAKEVTGSDGTVSFTDLQKGQYVLKETKAPMGYILGDDETDVKISGSETRSYTVVNTKDEKPTPPTPDEPTKSDEPKPGEPTNPDEQNPNEPKPGAPTNPVEPTKPNQPDTPTNEGEYISAPGAPKETAALPNTGHPLNTWMLGFTGLSMILVGVVLSKRKII